MNDDTNDAYTRGWLDCVEAQRILIDHLDQQLQHERHLRESSDQRAYEAAADAAEAQLILRQTHQAIRTAEPQEARP